MKAKALEIAIIAGLVLSAGIAHAEKEEKQAVAIRDIKLLDEQVVVNPSDKYKSNNWERRERRERWGERGERRGEGWGERRR